MRVPRRLTQFAAALTVVAAGTFTVAPTAAAAPAAATGSALGTRSLAAVLTSDDLAFRLLVRDLTGKSLRSERAVFAAVAGLGIDTVETVLLYHVVPGATITAKQALAANGAKLTTAQGGAIRVPFTHVPLVLLRDLDPNDANPFVVQFDLNRGNRQIAHGISLVLRPADL
jgi:uncharacterized surface protein with fasciclin (FAS1) repeats